MSKSKSTFDTPWKTILYQYFEHFFAFCLPEQYKEIDWARGYKMLDKELRKAIRETKIANCVADNLIGVYSRDGTETWILIHVEVQANRDSTFEERMYIYNYRIFDHYHIPVISMAILIDKMPNWRPGFFKLKIWEYSVEMRFPIIKLLDYRARVEELELSENPFAMVILAQLSALEKAADDIRLFIKLHLIRRLFNKNWKKEDVRNLLIFIDWVIALPRPLELKYEKCLENIEKEKQMAYMTTFERLGMERGIQKGESAMLLNQLEHKFETIPNNYLELIKNANSDLLLKWGKRVLETDVLEEVFMD